jgi:predicted ATPase
MLRIVITGGPGAGKTALIAALAAAGHATVAESARAIIAERRARGLPPRPDPPAFAREILRRDIDKYNAVSSAAAPWVFFDRSVIESIGYLHDVAPLAQDELARLLAAHPMHPIVFVLPPWPEIYSTDAERDHTFSHAVRVYEGLARWYRACGYTLHEVPRVSVAERAAYVLKVLTDWGSNSGL